MKLKLIFALSVISFIISLYLSLVDDGKGVVTINGKPSIAVPWNETDKEVIAKINGVYVPCVVISVDGKAGIYIVKHNDINYTVTQLKTLDTTATDEDITKVSNQNKLAMISIIITLVLFIILVIYCASLYTVYTKQKLYRGLIQ